MSEMTFTCRRDKTRARYARPGSPAKAYTVNVRINRFPRDLERVIGVNLAHSMNVTEVTEGLVVFAEEEIARIYLDLTDDADQIFSIDGKDAAKAMSDSNGVLVVVDEPVVPSYLANQLLSEAHEIA